jgi:hypothetical protein
MGICVERNGSGLAIVPGYKSLRQTPNSNGEEITMKYFALLLIVCLLIQPFASAQNLSSNWSSVKYIPIGQSLVVQTALEHGRKGHSQQKGLLQNVTDAALTLSIDGKNVDISSAEVYRVYVLRGRPFLKGLLIGAAVGTAGGAGIGAIAGRNDKAYFFEGPGFDAAVGAALGFLSGSITGLIVGSTRHKKDLVYEASTAKHLSP